VSHDDLVLEATDGSHFAAFLATPEEPARVGVVILPDVRGLYRFYEELALRFAERGYASLAFDYFGRTAGVEKRADDFEYMPHVQQTTPEGVAADVAAAMKYLRSKDGGAVKSVFTVGFCFGGSNSWNQSAEHPDLSGCIGFYGRPSRAEPNISKMKAPLLILIAGADQATTPEQNEEFLEALTKAGVPHDSHVYEGAPHSFFDRSFAQWKDACDDAWRRMLDFVKKHS